MLPRAAGVLKQARSAGLPVIYVQVGFRPNFPEISPRKCGIQRHKEFLAGPGAAIHSSVAPETEDIVVTKHRVGAFVETDLVILRAKDIDTLILMGISTSGVEAWPGN